MLARKLATGHHDSRLGAQIISELLSAAPDPPPPDLVPATAQGTRLLFFDGGSRGNPGPGGSGAAIIEVSTSPGTATPLWCGAMSYAHPSTTNNQAEYRGVIAGLQAAHQQGWSGLHVIGDSQLILGQLRGYRPPKNPRLLPLYCQARRLADQLGVVHWHHHYRVANKMADAAANTAMDTAASFQAYFPTTRPEVHGVLQHLASDVATWHASQATS